MNQKTYLSKKILDQLVNIVGADHIKTDHESLQTFGQDCTRVYSPDPLAIVFPISAEHVQAIVKLAIHEKRALVPSGGRTGLSGGAMAINKELVVSFDRMNKISEFDALSRTVKCQAGVITAELQQFADDHGLYYPVDFASKGSSQIGGNISTNAGGIKVMKYGMTRQWVAGLTVVTGNGEILHLNHGLVKNNTGYDLRQLFIGAEGTLGFVVEAIMRLTKKPEDLQVMVMGVNDFSDIMHVLDKFQNNLDLTAFEFFSDKALEKVVTHQGLKCPLETSASYYILLELENSVKNTKEKACELFDVCLKKEWVLDGIMSQSLAQNKNLWRLREGIGETILKSTPYKYDISTVISKIPDCLKALETLIDNQHPDFETIWFGHIGDGNVHLNILKPESLEKNGVHSPV